MLRGRVTMPFIHRSIHGLPFIYTPVLRGRLALSDGVIAEAVAEAVDSGSLYFAAAGNYGTGLRFTSVSLGSAHIDRTTTGGLN